jgi:hypothetical protein
LIFLFLEHTVLKVEVPKLRLWYFTHHQKLVSLFYHPAKWKTVFDDGRNTKVSPKLDGFVVEVKIRQRQELSGENGLNNP